MTKTKNEPKTRSHKISQQGDQEKNETQTLPKTPKGDRTPSMLQTAKLPEISNKTYRTITQHPLIKPSKYTQQLLKHKILPFCKKKKKKSL